jgi:hypothetical protein
MVGRALHGPRTRIGLFAAAVFLSAAALGTAYADQVMRVGMTASDVPNTGGIPNNGGEGFRFLGYPVFDSLVNWDFKHPNETADVTPGLATSWGIDEVDHTRWIFHLRDGVKFHDGTDFNADAVIFTLGQCCQVANRMDVDGRRTATRGLHCRRSSCDVTPCAKGGIASRAVLVGTEVMAAELEVVVDPAVGGEETQRMTR